MFSQDLGGNMEKLSLEQMVSDLLLRQKELEQRLKILEDKEIVGGVFTDGTPAYVREHLKNKQSKQEDKKQ